MKSLLTATLIAAMSTLTLAACEKSSGASAGSGSGLNIKEIASTSRTQLVWGTSATISPARIIEVGEHPNIELDKFEMGNRAQRVRFHVADDVRTTKLVTGSPQDLLLQSDATIAKSENSKWSPYALVIESPANLGWAHFADDSTYNGLTVSPQFMLCASTALKNLKEASEARSRIFQNWQINEVNIFVKPVQHSAEAESKMAIANHKHALNFQVSMWTRSGDCFTPSVEEIGTALDIADQRVED